MRRRQFISLLGGAAAAWPLAARAQQAGRIYRFGILHNQGPQAPQFPPFYDELRRLGFVEGHRLRQAIAEPEATALRTAATWLGVAHERSYRFAAPAL